MALRAFISLRFLPKRLAENPCQFSENFNYNNHIGGPDGQAFPLPSSTRAHFTPASHGLHSAPFNVPDRVLRCGWLGAYRFGVRNAKYARVG